MELKKMIASWVRQVRTESGLSGDDLAAKLIFELKVTKGNSKANISHWETGKHSPDLEQLLAIVRITGKSLPVEMTDAMMGIRVANDTPPIPVNYIERIDQDEMELLSDYRAMTETTRKSFRNAASVAPKEALTSRLRNKS